jgi:hypothetical protein
LAQSLVQEVAIKASPEQECVMSDVVDFQQYAEKALRAASKHSTDNEVREYVRLAHVWGRAAAAVARQRLRRRPTLVKSNQTSEKVRIEIK